ncbi:MAG: hypothetical protein IPK26_05560 [Planctomycetes bacterium]|nr:hypothetical protein [Planctomycetota bacterium]
MNLGAADLVFLAGFVVYTGIRHHWERRIGKPPTQQRHGDGLEIALLALVFVGACCCRGETARPPPGLGRPSCGEGCER